MKITVEMIMKEEPCYRYPLSDVNGYIGDGLSLYQLCNLKIPVVDRLWAIRNVSEIWGALKPYREDFAKYWKIVIRNRNIHATFKTRRDSWGEMVDKIREIAKENNL